VSLAFNKLAAANQGSSNQGSVYKAHGASRIVGELERVVKELKGISAEKAN
jgi:hypothetical protein